MKNNTLYRASRLLSEAFDLDDPMNGIESEESPISYNDPDENLDTVEEGEPEELDKTFDVDVANPVCPCCGAKLNIIDTSDSEEEEDDEIEAMDPSLEPEESQENEDSYVSLNDINFDEEEDDEEEDIDDVDKSDDEEEDIDADEDEEDEEDIDIEDDED